jgi:hypothetical protein
MQYLCNTISAIPALRHPNLGDPNAGYLRFFLGEIECLKDCVLDYDE